MSSCPPPNPPPLTEEMYARLLLAIEPAIKRRRHLFQYLPEICDDDMRQVAIRRAAAAVLKSPPEFFKNAANLAANGAILDLYKSKINDLKRRTAAAGEEAREQNKPHQNRDRLATHVTGRTATLAALARSWTAENLSPGPRKRNRSFTRSQIMAMLVLRVYLRAGYRGITDIAAQDAEIRSALLLHRTPHHTLLWRASRQRVYRPLAVRAVLHRCLRAMKEAE